MRVFLGVFQQKDNKEIKGTLTQVDEYVKDGVYSPLIFVGRILYFEKINNYNMKFWDKVNRGITKKVNEKFYEDFEQIKY